MKDLTANYYMRTTRLRDLMTTMLSLMLFIPAPVFAQTWVHLNNVGANITGTSSSTPPVSDALCLSVNGKIYVLGSTTFTGSSTLAKMWEYNPTLDGWAEKSTYPGTGSSLFCGFTIGGMIYAGTGNAGSVHATSDFYKYNPTTNTWTQISDLPVARIWATAFSIGDKGYVTAGEGMTMGSYLGDLWEYDTTSNNWSQKTSFPGVTRALPSSFSSGGSGYVGLGFSNNVWHNDFYRYNPASDTWTVVSSFPGAGRCGAGCVTIGNTAIILCGNTGMTTYNDCYSYDASSDSWDNFISFQGSSRSNILSGNVGSKIFAGGGSASGGSITNNDWWSLQTTVGIELNVAAKGKVCIYKSSPEEFVIKSKVKETNGETFKVYDGQGRLIQSGSVAENGSKIRIDEAGVYYVVFDSGKVPAMRFVAE